MPAQPTIFRFGPYELRARTRELYKAGTKLRLRPQPFQVLSVLVERAGDVVTREELRELLWSAETFVDFEHGLNTSIKELRGILSDSASEPRYIETLPRLGYRLMVQVDVSEPVVLEKALEKVKRDTDSARLPMPPNAQAAPGIGNRWKAIPAVAIALVALAVGAWWISSRKAHALTNKDTIVLADFTNSTGDGVFDYTLRQGLSAQLEQSPFLNLLPGERIAQTLSLMTQPKDSRLTSELVMEVCKRTGSAATVTGSIDSLGSQYVLGLRAVACRNGDPLANIQMTASGKEQVLKALGNAASKLREKLGESLTSVQKYDTPQESVTTSSLEALNSYSLGVKARREKGSRASIPFFRQAIQLDPNFAMAYHALGINYWNMLEPSQGSRNLEKAFALRERVSRREYFQISADYFDDVPGDFQKSDEIYKLWAQTYPQDLVPLDHLGNDYLFLGQYPQALEVLLEEKWLAGTGNYDFVNLWNAYLGLNRFHEARLILEDAITRKEPPDEIHSGLYLTDFVEQNFSAMQTEVAWASGRTGEEYNFLYMESDTEAYAGHRKAAWTLSQKAAEAANRGKQNEVAAIFTASGGLQQAEFGNSAGAVDAANSALALAHGRDVKMLASLVLARAGFANRAKILADEVARSNPSSTILNFYWLPAVRAGIELDLNRPAQAIETLQKAEPYELGMPAPMGPGTLYPAYIRGQAYLRLGQGSQAAAEFQKLVDHPGCLMNFVLGPLARLQIGRAYLLDGDKSKARAAYQDFLALWKDADPDIPILKQAKAEYAKLN